MNWRGYVVLGLLLAVAVGVFSYKLGVEAVVERKFRVAEQAIETATNNKLDVTDIRLVDLAGTEDGALFLYLYGAGATQSPLTDRELEDVDVEFMTVVNANETTLVVWVWVRPGSGSDTKWYSTVVTACDRTQLLASKADAAVPAGCNTQQSFSELETKHLRWLNE